MSGKIPVITHLQYAVLSALMDGERSGQSLRERLAARGIRKSGPVFYQMMSRIEEAGFVKGWYIQLLIDGQAIKERHYRLTGVGEKQCKLAREFYLSQVSVAPIGGLASA
jgi:hypothetical protein